MENKEDTTKLQKLKWQCRRGMLELDLLLNAFLDDHFNTLSIEDKECFSQLLQESDQTLYEWLVKQTSPPALPFQSLITAIRGACCKA